MIDSSFLAPAHFVDSDHPDVIAFARNAIGDATADSVKASRLFRAVREHLRYDPYVIAFDPRTYKASAILKQESSYCIPKAVLLAAAARAVGIPARLGFADVKNHLSSKKLLDWLGSDLFVFHGFTELWIEDKPYKLTPAFNSALCDRFGVPALDLDPNAPADALLQPFDGQGRQYMTYERDRGLFLDLPFEEMANAFKTQYPKMRSAAAEHDAAFHS